MEVAPIKSSHLPPVSDGFIYNEVEDECGHNACHYALALLIQVAGGNAGKSSDTAWERYAMIHKG